GRCACRVCAARPAADDATAQRRICPGRVFASVSRHGRAKRARKEGTDSVNSTTPINAAPADLVAEVEALGQRLSLVRERIGEVIFGQAEVVEQALITLL